MKKLIFGVGISMLITMNSSANNSSQLSNTQQAAQSFEQNSAQSLIPVSYTHLTLPTIYSV